MNFAQIIFKNVAIQFLGKLVVIFLKILGNVFLARYLLVEGFGEYSVLFVMIGLIEVAIEFGSTNVLAGELVKNWKQRNRFLSDIIIIKLILAGTVVGFVTTLSKYIGFSQELRIALYLGSVVCLFLVLISLSLVIFEAKLKLQYSVLANTADAMVFFLFVIGVIKWKGTLIHLVLGLIVSKAVNAGISFFSARKWVTFRLTQPNPIELKALFKKILPLGVGMFMVMLYNKIDIIMLTKMSGTEATGIYSAAYKLVYLFPAISGMLMVSIYPLMVKYLKEDRKQMQLIFQKAFDYSAIFAVFSFVILFFMSDLIISTLYGEYFSRSVPVLQILAGGVSIMLLTSIVGPTYAVVDKQDKTMLLATGGVIMNFTLNLIMIPRLSFIGAAVATVLTEVSIFIPATCLLMKYLQFRLSLSVTAKALLAGLICSIFLYIMDVYNLLFLSALGFLSYFLILYLMGAIPKGDLMALKAKA